MERDLIVNVVRIPQATFGKDSTVLTNITDDAGEHLYMDRTLKVS